MSLLKSLLFTSESVSAGHPDKLCDRISDAILDGYLAHDPNARVACETLASDGRIIVAGEFKANDAARQHMNEQAEGIVRQTIRDVGYGSADLDIDPDTCRVEFAFNSQSSEIGDAVDGSTTLGAGDQGIVFGYACNETPEFMPLAWSLATRLIDQAQKANRLAPNPETQTRTWGLRPDGKAQVTVRYEDGRPIGVQTVVMSWQHEKSLSVERVREWLEREVVDVIIPKAERTEDFVLHLNPAGSFTVGGPKADTGLTGRKIIVDTYGGYAPHGGGAFSGKDPSKVDRSGAYAARWIAKNIIAAGLADRVTVQLSYAIGLCEPISVTVDTAGTGEFPDVLIRALVRGTFDLTPQGIIEALNLKRPIYTATSSLGHFGAFIDPDLCLWERTDMADVVRRTANKQARLLSAVGFSFGAQPTSPLIN